MSEKPKSKITFLDLDKYLGNPSVISVKEEEDEIERELKKIRKRKLQKLADLELEKYLAEAEKELVKLKGEKEKGEEAKIDLTPQIAMQLAKLPEEEKRKVIETIQMLKLAEKVPPQMASIMPLMLIGYAKANPGQSMESMAKFAEIMANQIKTGMEMAQKSQTERSPVYNPVDLIKTFSEVVKENIKEPIQELVQRVQPQPSALEQLLLDDKLFERAKALGLFGGGTREVNPEIELKIEELRTQREIELEKMRQEHNRWLAQQRLEQQKWEQIGKLFEGPIGRTIQTLGAGAARKISGMGGQASVTQVTCPRCNRQFPVFADAEKAICPYCGAVLAKTGGEEAEETGQAKEEETKSKQKSKRK